MLLALCAGGILHAVSCFAERLDSQQQKRDAGLGYNRLQNAYSQPWLLQQPQNLMYGADYAQIACRLPQEMQ